MRFPKLIALGAIATAIFFSSCDKSLLEKDFTFTSANFTILIDSGIQAGTRDLASTVVTNTLDSFLNANKLKKSNLKKIKLSEAECIQTNSADNFDIIDSLSTKFSANGQSDVNIGSLSPVPDGVNSIKLNVNTDTDFSNFFNASTFTFKAGGKLNAPTTKKYIIKVKLKYTVTVGV